MAPRQEQQESLLASSSGSDKRSFKNYGSSLTTTTSSGSSNGSDGGNNNNDDISTMTIDDAIERLGYGRFQHHLLWAAGLCLMADGTEVLLLSFLTLVLRTITEWELTESETSFIVSSVFLGATFGSLVLGRLADMYGRKPIFTLTAFIIAIFGIATGLSPNFHVLVLCRFMVGFGVGGLTVPFDTFCEFLPGQYRGTNLLAIEFFWSSGAIVVAALAYYTLGQGGGIETTTNTITVAESHGWRIFVMLCAVPCILSTVWGMYCVPESPRWLLTTKKDPKQALKVLREAAAVNGKNPMELFPPNTRLRSDESLSLLSDDDDDEFSSPSRGEAGILDLFSPKWIRTTLFLWGTWIGFAFLYYGGVIATTLVFAESQSAIEAKSENREASYHFDYGALFVSNSAEILGVVLIVLTVDKVGRIPIQVFSYLLGGIVVLALSLLAASDSHEQYFYSMVVLAFGVRMLMMAASCTTWVSTAEILTTDIRSTGHSAANAMARIGGFLVPYVVSPDSKLTTIGYSMFSVALFTAYCAWNLPETKGLDLGVATLKKTPKQEGGDISSCNVC